MNTDHDALIDSLHHELENDVRLTTINDLNRTYVEIEAYDRAIALLEAYENQIPWDDQAMLHVLIGDNLLYAGSLLGARDRYLTTVRRYTKSPAANDALERLYLLETARSDTAALKRLCYCLSRMYCEQWKSAEDSLKVLLATPLRQQVYYYLALLYKTVGNIPHAVSMLDMVEQEFPAQTLLFIPLLRAEIYLLLQQYDEAYTILEDFIIEYPQSIYAVKARRLLVTIQ
jgi:tetratricopeptide (TPR) repeat protein